MKKITLQLATILIALFSLSTYSQSTINITTSGGSYASEKWVSVTTGENGTGNEVWAQGDGTYSNGSGLINVDIPIAPGTYYVNCYDQYSDGWDGTLISVTAYGSVLADNGGASPNNSTDNDASSGWDGPENELEASLMIVVPNPPSCAPPVSLSVANIADVSADMSWSQGGSETSWEYALLPSSDPEPSSGTSINTMMYNATSLSSLTEYTFYVRSNCGNEFSNWASTTFTTLAPPITNDECSGAVDLDAFMNNDNSCTLTYVGSNVGATNSAGEVAPSATCTNASSDPNPKDVWFSVTVPSTGGFIYDDISTPGFSSIVEVYTGSCGSLTALNPVNCTNAGTEKTFGGLTAGETVYLRYWDYGSNDEGNLEFCIKPSPSCVDPSALDATSITESSAILSWTENGSATVWNVEFGVDGFTATGTPTDAGVSNSYLKSGLSDNTDYDFYVQSDCGGGDTSEWVGPYSFTTALSPVVPDYINNFETYPGDGWTEAAGALGSPTGTSSSWIQDDYGNDTGSTNGKSARINIFGSSIDEYLISPNFNLSSGDHYLNFDVALTDYANSNPPENGSMGADDYVVLLVTQDGTNWTELRRWDANSTIPTSREATPEIQLSGYGGTTKFAFYAFSDTSNEDNDFFIDNFQISKFPLSIAKNVIEGFSIYPNPAKDVLNLKALDNINEISIYNLLGQEVERQSPNALNTEVTISDLPTGVYVVKVKVGEQLGTYKIVKE